MEVEPEVVEPTFVAGALQGSSLWDPPGLSAASSIAAGSGLPDRGFASASRNAQNVPGFGGEPPSAARGAGGSTGSGGGSLRNGGLGGAGIPTPKAGGVGSGGAGLAEGLIDVSAGEVEGMGAEVGRGGGQTGQRGHVGQLDGRAGNGAGAPDALLPGTSEVGLEAGRAPGTGPFAAGPTPSSNGTRAGRGRGRGRGAVGRGGGSRIWKAVLDLTVAIDLAVMAKLVK
ncbi:hypothetical protein KFL_004090020 [Klebsormidium nitens]|uniref:Uncharacterized protein n=1 Tax=Klebsormidium nitens TaxID=105231 RepID=A0A1Y1IGL4_KLENI|nr:hypothetical protein KFL_004090020 [Klebsormidium nitens]|eukprot:GAQ88201.1 hypothetical protein KFL_004090020 [Klebsormidium nitens]